MRHFLPLAITMFALTVPAVGSGTFLAQGGLGAEMSGQGLGELPNVLKLRSAEGGTELLCFIEGEQGEFTAECDGEPVPFRYEISGGTVTAIVVDGVRYDRDGI